MTHSYADQQLAGLPWHQTMCFTGHRPEKLPGGRILDGLLHTLHYNICYAIDNGYTHFLTGLADGIDYYAADMLFSLRRQDPRIQVIGIQPCADYEAFFRRRGYSLSHLRLMRENVDRLVMMPGSSWDRGIFYQRNRMLVDHASAIIAVCGEERSGSLQTFCYAQKRKLAFCRIYPFPPAGTLPPPESWPTERSGI